jgi:succinate dehydrogenase/fumarate reductase cytochrome b subunit
MTIDLGHLREYLHAAEGPSAGEMPIPTNWLAAMQALMITFASVYRFYCNECRPQRGADGSFATASTATLVLGYGSLFIACVIFGFIEHGLVGNLKAPWEFEAHPSLENDAWALLLLTLVWIGYPIVTIGSRVALWDLPGDEYNGSVSLAKDVAYGVLDTFSKAGLAIYMASKAFWMPAALELALISANHTNSTLQ